MIRNVQHFAFLAVFVAVSSSTSQLWAVEPNPLENAYWRFEEGTATDKVTPRNSDAVFDLANENHMQAFMNDTVDAAPTYTSQAAPKPLKSGLPNNLALDFFPNQDIFTSGKQINNGFIESGGGFTVEAAFYTYNPARFGAIIAKEGLPGGGDLPTFALKTTADTENLRVQQFDAAGNLVNVDSLSPLLANQWYYAAVVNDGSQLALWLDSGSGYELQGTAPVSGALYQGPDPNDPDWNKNWAIGRGVFDSDGSRPDGIPSDWFDGIIDEVRLSNTALSPSGFLFAPADDGLTGDYNEDGKVDAADYVLWRKDPASYGGAQGYNDWVANFGAMASPGTGGGASLVPEPASIVFAGFSLFFAAAVYRRGRCG